MLVPADLHIVGDWYFSNWAFLIRNSPMMHKMIDIWWSFHINPQVNFISKVVCSLKCFFKKVIMWFCRESNSEQLLILNFMLKIRSYSSGNRRNFGKMSGIFAPSSKEFLSFSKIWLYLTLKNAISCHLRQKIEKMAR